MGLRGAGRCRVQKRHARGRSPHSLGRRERLQPVSVRRKGDHGMADDGGAGGKPPKGKGSDEDDARAAIVRASSDLERPPTSRVDINLLVINLTQKSESTEETVESVRQTLEVLREWERFELDTFKERTDAVIDAKRRDPDEIEKRKNNGVRRGLKWCVAGLAVACLAGTVWAAVAGLTVVATVLGIVTGLAVAGLIVLASGESVSASDVVKIFNALARMGRAPEEQPPPRPERRTPKGGRK